MRYAPLSYCRYSHSAVDWVDPNGYSACCSWPPSHLHIILLLAILVSCSCCLLVEQWKLTSSRCSPPLRFPWHSCLLAIPCFALHPFASFMYNASYHFIPFHPPILLPSLSLRAPASGPTATQWFAACATPSAFRLGGGERSRLRGGEEQIARR